MKKKEIIITSCLFIILICVIFYDYNDKLINVITVWNNGCLFYNGVIEEYLDNSDKNILFNYIE